MDNNELIERVKESYSWELGWVYDGWGVSTPYSQKEWNQTLMTKINQISAQIHRGSHSGSADKIIAHYNLGPLFGSLEYYNLNERELMGRYDVVLTNEIDENTLYVVNGKQIGTEVIPIVKVTEGDDEMNEIDFTHISAVSDEDVKSYRDKLIGKIHIINF